MVFGLFKSKVTKVAVKKRTGAGKTKKSLRGALKTRKPLRRILKPKIKARVAKEVEIGKITHYFPHVKAGVLKVKKSSLALGEEVHIKGHTTDFRQKVTSMQINGAPIKTAQKGKEIGLLVKRRVRGNDTVYKVSR
jgi:hypothetical protein